jgi:cyclase
MKTIFVIIVSLTFISLTAQPPYKHFELKKLTPGVYAAIAKNGGYAICNAGIIDLGKELLVIDPFMTPQAAEELKSAIKSVLNKPVRYVVNSHFHNDHIRGNQVFSGATIISTAMIRDLISKNEPLEIKYENEETPKALKALKAEKKPNNPWENEEYKLWAGYYEGIIKSHSVLKTTLPNLTFEDSLTIYGTNTTVQLLSYGDGHTPSDIFLYLPREKIAFMGDLLFVQFHPWVGDSKIDDWVNYLEKVKKLDVEKFIPGHGPVGNTQDVTLMINYLKSVEEIASQFKKEDKPDDVAINAKLPVTFAEWHGKRFFAFNVNYARAQQK